MYTHVIYVDVKKHQKKKDKVNPVDLRLETSLINACLKPPPLAVAPALVAVQTGMVASVTTACGWNRINSKHCKVSFFSADSYRPPSSIPWWGPGLSWHFGDGVIQVSPWDNRFGAILKCGIIHWCSGTREMFAVIQASTWQGARYLFKKNILKAKGGMMQLSSNVHLNRLTVLFPCIHFISTFRQAGAIFPLLKCSRKFTQTSIFKVPSCWMQLSPWGLIKCWIVGIWEFMI